jgi:hypothetical protein
VGVRDREVQYHCSFLRLEFPVVIFKTVTARSELSVSEIAPNCTVLSSYVGSQTQLPDVTRETSRLPAHGGAADISQEGNPPSEGNVLE